MLQGVAVPDRRTTIAIAGGGVAIDRAATAPRGNCVCSAWRGASATRHAVASARRMPRFVQGLLDAVEQLVADPLTMPIPPSRWMMTDLLQRITIDPERMHGRPSIRGLRITVADVLGLLSAGQTRAEILRDYNYLEDADIDAVLAFAKSRHAPAGS